MPQFPKLDLNNYTLREVAVTYIWLDEQLVNPDAAVVNSTLLSKLLGGSREIIQMFGLDVYGPKFIQEVIMIRGR